MSEKYLACPKCNSSNIREGGRTATYYYCINCKDGIYTETREDNYVSFLVHGNTKLKEQLEKSQKENEKMKSSVAELDSFITHIQSEMRRAWDKRANCIGCCGGVDIPEEELCRCCWHITYNKKGYALWDTESTFEKLPEIYKELNKERE